MISLRRVLVACLFFGALSSARVAHAQFAAKPFGLGIQAGDPSGLTAKFWLGGDRYALQLAAGSHGYRDELYNGAFLTADVVYRFAGSQAGSARVGFHVGLGVGWTRYDGCYRDYFGRYWYCGTYADRTAIVARVPVAANLYLRGAPIELFVEVAPGLAVDPEFVEVASGGFGGRFYF